MSATAGGQAAAKTAIFDSLKRLNLRLLPMVEAMRSKPGATQGPIGFAVCTSPRRMFCAIWAAGEQDLRWTMVHRLRTARPF